MDHTQQLIDCLQRWDEEDEAGRPASASSVCGGRTELIPEVVALSDFRNRLERLLGTLDGLDTVVRAPGDTLATPGLPSIPGYAVSRMLAEGGMGQVYRATHLKLGREVALKVIRPDRVSADLLGRFQTEAEAVAKLDDPNIVQIYEVGEYDEGGAKIPYLALEFVPGGTLESRAGASPMPPAEAARIVRILARAVAHAHARGIVHRDLKPDNVLIAPPADEPSLNAAVGRPKITDFGLARRDAGGPSATRPGSIMGTPSYMAPEQAAGDPAGKPADVYALGAILYRLLTGRVVFPRESWIDALHDVRHKPPQPPGERVPCIPPALEALCLRCLEKDAGRRPTAAELAAGLDRPAAPDSLSPTATFHAPPHPRRRLLIVAAALALLVAAGVGGWAMWPRTKPVPSDLPRTEPAVLGPLKGHLDAWMSRDGDPLRAGGVAMNDPASRPMRPGDKIQVEAKLNRPAYVYIVWVDSEGGVSLMYPWIDGDWKRRQQEVKAAEFHLPNLDPKKQWWEMGPGEPGFETMVLLCRDDRLPADVNPKAILGTFGPQPFAGQSPTAVAWFEDGRTVRDEKQRAPKTTAVEGGDPLERVNAAIHERAKAYFGYTRAITYGNAGGK